MLSYAITNQVYFPSLKRQLIKKIGQFRIIKKTQFICVIKCDTNNNEAANPVIKYFKRI